jgi:tungstate transport system substrate-binding protein
LAFALLLVCAVSLTTIAPARSADRFVLVQSTTSTQNSGLFEYLLPMFTAKTGIDVRVVAVGTGQAIKNAQNGDGDVLLVHDEASEKKFVADGWGMKRHHLMYNDFVIIGPAADPANVAAVKTAAQALNNIAAAKAPFVSRGDDSGTHKAELRLWNTNGIDVKSASGTWYREVGQGMGQTINIAIGMNAYTLTDRASWSAFKNKAEHKTLLEGDRALFNQYGVILVNPEKHAHVKAADGQTLIDWLVSPDGQAAIASFKIGGEQQFFPNAAP